LQINYTKISIGFGTEPLETPKDIPNSTIEIMIDKGACHRIIAIDANSPLSLRAIGIGVLLK
jgi:hypothetical protein